jgi:hypothetical protein
LSACQQGATPADPIPRRIVPNLSPRGCSTASRPAGRRCRRNGESNRKFPLVKGRRCLASSSLRNDQPRDDRLREGWMSAFCPRAPSRSDRAALRRRQCLTILWLAGQVQPGRETTTTPETTLETAAMTLAGDQRNRDSLDREDGLDPRTCSCAAASGETATRSGPDGVECLAQHRTARRLQRLLGPYPVLPAAETLISDREPS